MRLEFSRNVHSGEVIELGYWRIFKNIDVPGVERDLVEEHNEIGENVSKYSC